jgi:hypothetical protein
VVDAVTYRLISKVTNGDKFLGTEFAIGGYSSVEGTAEQDKERQDSEAVLAQTILLGRKEQQGVKY